MSQLDNMGNNEENQTWIVTTKWNRLRRRIVNMFGPHYWVDIYDFGRPSRPCWSHYLGRRRG